MDEDTATTGVSICSFMGYCLVFVYMILTEPSSQTERATVRGGSPTMGPERQGQRFMKEFVTKRVEAGVNGLARFIVHHWLLLTNIAMLVFILPTLLAPYLASVGAYWPSRVIYLFYRLTCHQRPERSFFLFGYKVAICARCTAIYMSFWGLGLLYGVWKATPWGRRHRPRPLSLKWLAVLAAPMFIDGVTQLVGLRESTNLLRTITGALVGVGAGLFAYPVLDEGFAQSQQDFGH